jgi:hypothetical protein
MPCSSQGCEQRSQPAAYAQGGAGAPGASATRPDKVDVCHTGLARSATPRAQVRTGRWTPRVGLGRPVGGRAAGNAAWCRVDESARVVRAIRPSVARLVPWRAVRGVSAPGRPPSRAAFTNVAAADSRQNRLPEPNLAPVRTGSALNAKGGNGRRVRRRRTAATGRRINAPPSCPRRWTPRRCRRRWRT